MLPFIGIIQINSSAQCRWPRLICPLAALNKIVAQNFVGVALEGKTSDDFILCLGHKISFINITSAEVIVSLLIFKHIRSQKRTENNV